jgi:hypothetical protein
LSLQWNSWKASEYILKPFRVSFGARLFFNHLTHLLARVLFSDACHYHLSLRASYFLAAGTIYLDI